MWKKSYFSPGWFKNLLLLVSYCSPCILCDLVFFGILWPPRRQKKLHNLSNLASVFQNSRSQKYFCMRMILVYHSIFWWTRNRKLKFPIFVFVYWFISVVSVVGFCNCWNFFRDSYLTWCVCECEAFLKIHNCRKYFVATTSWPLSTIMLKLWYYYFLCDLWAKIKSQCSIIHTFIYL